MLFMESYVCYCSVRLGVIVVGLISITRSLVFSGFFFARGVHVFDSLINLLENDSQYKTSTFVRKLIDWVEHSPEQVAILFQLNCYATIAAALLGIYGAIKLHKWFLWPLAIFEFLFFLKMMSLHIVLMIMLKKLINLGLLIMLTLAGSFGVLYLGYNCVTCIAMYQIISLVKSSQYCKLYGSDPFHPLAQHSQDKAKDQSVQQLHVLTTPDNTDIDEQKRLAKLGLWPRQQHGQIISVIPVRNEGYNNMPAPKLKWWQQQALDMDVDRANDSVIYRNWQHGELQRSNAWNRPQNPDQWRWRY